MRYLSSIIFCLWAGCAWAFPPGFIGAVTQSASGGSTSSVSDNFDRGNGALGASWTTVTAGPFTSSPEILDQHVRVATVAAPAMAIHTFTASANQYAQITIPASVEDCGVVLRMNSSGNGYAVRAYNATTLWFARLTAGVYTQLGADITVSSVAGKVLRAEINGGTLTVKIDGATIDTRTDSTYTTGSVGIVLKGQPEADNFEAGSI